MKIPQRKPTRLDGFDYSAPGAYFVTICTKDKKCLLLVIIETGGDGTPPLQDIIGRLKSYTTGKYGAELWQRSFHDHIIRGEEDYIKIAEYIDTNPLKWELDCFSDVPYFVQLFKKIKGTTPKCYADDI